MTCDLVVVGGGPVGLATALYARRAGLEVTVCEARPGPIDKACGEGLMPGAMAALRDLRVDPPGQAIDGIRYVAGSAHAQAAFRAGPGRGIRRTVLHEALSSAMASAGVRMQHRTVRHIDQDADGVDVDGLRARYAIAADGLHSPTRRSLGLDRPTPGTPRYGLRRHYVQAPWSRHVEVHWSEGAEAYVTPVAPDLVGVALLSATRRGFEEQLAAFGALRARLTGPAATAVRGAGPLRQHASRRVAGRVLLVGDAGGYVDALTGEGIALGLAQARAAVAALVAEDPRRYETAWYRVTRRYRWLTGALLQGARHPAVRRALVPAAAAMPTVFSAAVNQLARPA